MSFPFPKLIPKPFQPAFFARHPGLFQLPEHWWPHVDQGKWRCSWKPHWDRHGLQNGCDLLFWSVFSPEYVSPGPPPFFFSIVCFTHRKVKIPCLPLCARPTLWALAQFITRKTALPVFASSKFPFSWCFIAYQSTIQFTPYACYVDQVHFDLCMIVMCRWSQVCMMYVCIIIIIITHLGSFAHDFCYIYIYIEWWMYIYIYIHVFCLQVYTYVILIHGWSFIHL